MNASHVSAGMPLRAGSVIVTILGDAIVPRGGRVSLQTLTALLGELGINPGQARTALSRLVADGWLRREREGKSAHYELAPERLAEFERAMARVYSGERQRWSGRFLQAAIMSADGPFRAEMRAKLEMHGFGVLTPLVFLKPAPLGPVDELDLPSGVVTGWFIPSSTTELSQFSASIWPVAEAAEAYRDFLDRFEPMTGADVTNPGQAFEARILAIHAYRRAVLKDPRLPDELLPGDWPGHAARRVCGRIYRAAFNRSEQWLNELTGQSPRALAAGKVAERFSDVLQEY